MAEASFFIFRQNPPLGLVAAHHQTSALMRLGAKHSGLVILQKNRISHNFKIKLNIQYSTFSMLPEIFFTVSDAKQNQDA